MEFCSLPGEGNQTHPNGTSDLESVLCCLELSRQWANWYSRAPSKRGGGTAGYLGAGMLSSVSNSFVGSSSAIAYDSVKESKSSCPRISYWPYRCDGACRCMGRRE